MSVYNGFRSGLLDTSLDDGIIGAVAVCGFTDVLLMPYCSASTLDRILSDKEHSAVDNGIRNICCQQFPMRAVMLRDVQVDHDHLLAREL
ncbi:hypothetical protein [Amycolatopsis sp. H20-H5]|uniref:hypothetical protein n=1 Tax=Amycolatopsis sp. H20-H5 TaxID=3046309 RepID=UPI002DBEBA15|nr:hypothetical protein [Amycolatopsis sp. H20-H5]MEC3981599.1 hypothetical protein [Amycolatopsis sp. H20-H5]